MRHQPQAKLTMEQAAEIRAKYEADRSVTQADLAREYGVSAVSIHNIVNGISYKGRIHKYSDELVQQVRQAYKAGDMYPEISEEFHMSYSDIEYVCLRGYAHVDELEPRCELREPKRKQENLEKMSEIS